MARALNSLGVGVAVGVLAVGSTIEVRHFVFEPGEQKSAYIQVVGASDAELRAKSYEELIDLEANVSRFGHSAPGLYMSSLDQEDRIERALTDKRSR
ncbi:hypothetical protein PUN71_022195 [Arthrobacter sp. NQ7]|uniref:hypothetical protein n=1 Tax=Arthrobacter sp. NQ7 TaxID=3032303 RepID=UPI00240F5CE7|nr:hypothetical protein [Arthrobacter sp. NQ7]MDJ0459922.1 hypothetical protein [Arthrobacter sp. NQ7]